MDRRERMNNQTVLLRAALAGWQGNMWTALPAVVQSYDAAAGTITAQPTIQVGVLQPDGSNVVTTMPVIPDVPVVFPAGGGFTLTFPLVAGDEVLLVFASRCIDAWWQSSGIQPQAEFRMHDLSDGFAIPGPKSQPKKLTNVSATNVQLRTDDGAGFMEIEPNGGSPRLRLVFPGGIDMVGPVTADGDISAGGDVVAASASPATMVTMLHHRHTGNNIPPTPGF